MLNNAFENEVHPYEWEILGWCKPTYSTSGTTVFTTWSLLYEINAEHIIEPIFINEFVTEASDAAEEFSAREEHRRMVNTCWIMQMVHVHICYGCVFISSRGYFSEPYVCIEHWDVHGYLIDLTWTKVMRGSWTMFLRVYFKDRVFRKNFQI